MLFETHHQYCLATLSIVISLITETLKEHFHPSNDINDDVKRKLSCPPQTSMLPDLIITFAI